MRSYRWNLRTSSGCKLWEFKKTVSLARHVAIVGVKSCGWSGYFWSSLASSGWPRGHAITSSNPPGIWTVGIRLCLFYVCYTCPNFSSPLFLVIPGCVDDEGHVIGLGETRSDYDKCFRCTCARGALWCCGWVALILNIGLDRLLQYLFFEWWQKP